MAAQSRQPGELIKHINLVSCFSFNEQSCLLQASFLQHFRLVVLFFWNPGEARPSVIWQKLGAFLGRKRQRQRDRGSELLLARKLKATKSLSRIDHWPCDKCQRDTNGNEMGWEEKRWDWNIYLNLPSNWINSVLIGEVGVEVLIEFWFEQVC